jgi:hypothetical protein
MKPFAKRLCLSLAFLTLTIGQDVRAGVEASITAGKPIPKAVELSGKVVETMDGGGYTYILLKNGQEKIWIAAPLMKVSVGQQLTLLPGYEMKNFTSKALNRKFDKVVFTGGVANTEVKLSPAAIKMAHQGVPMPGQPAPAAKPTVAKQASAAKSAAVAKAGKPAPVNIEQIAKAKGPNSYTIAQLYAKKKQLEKKPIVVRGRIVKVSPRILKRNWIHIQDGSGSLAKKNNNLIVTSKDLPKVGELVTVKGTLYNNMDFGSGYRYGLLVEGARIKN